MSNLPRWAQRHAEREIRLPRNNDERHNRVIDCIYQYLDDNGYDHVIQKLSEVSGRCFVRENINDELRPSTIMRALDALDEAEMQQVVDSEYVEERSVWNEILTKAQEVDQDISTGECVPQVVYTHSANILTLCFHPVHAWIAIGSADKRVKIVDYEESVVVNSVPMLFPAAVLCVDFNPVRHDLMLVSCMNGSHAVVDLSTNKEIQTFKDHQKYVVMVKWAPDGTMFATASSDHTAIVYVCCEDNGEQWQQRQTFHMVGAVESIEFVQQGDDLRLLIACQGDNYLHVCCMKTFVEHKRVNLNANGDDVVSFSPMYTHTTPDGRFSLVATDRHRVILVALESGKQLRNFYGAKNDSYAHPRCCFSRDGTRVYGSSADNRFVVWSIATEKVVHNLRQHTKTLRDLKRHPIHEIVATCSFDRTLCIWRPKTNE